MSWEYVGRLFELFLAESNLKNIKSKVKRILQIYLKQKYGLKQN